MIAPRDCATLDEWQALLSDELPAERSDALTEHLTSCTRCHRQLESLAGEAAWWDESCSQLLSIVEGETPSTQPPAAALPQRIAHYTTGELIGYGGMASVYRGYDEELQRPVAIKLLHAHLAATGRSRQRFLREAQSAAAIVHANVIPIYGVHNQDGLSFLVMPLVTGGTLQQRIQREGPLPPADALRIALQVSDALQAAHAQGVVHRDVKPANILLEEVGSRVWLSDFGLARALDDAALTASGMIAGTPAYMSPEQARGEAIDGRSDLYSLGCMLYSMLTARSPFEASNTLRLLRDIGEVPFPSVCRHREELPAWWDALLARFTARDPNARLRSADDASQLLGDCLKHLSEPARYPLPEFASAIPAVHAVPQRPWLRRRWMIGAAVCAVAIIAALVSTVSRPTSSPRGDTVATYENTSPATPPTAIPEAKSAQATTVSKNVPALDEFDRIRLENAWDDGLEPHLQALRDATTNATDDAPSASTMP